MRNFGILIGRSAKVRPPSSVGERLARAAKPAGHPLDEEVRELFQCACAAGDLDAAADVLSLMERWLSRRDYGDDQQRRDDSEQLLRMRGELERRYIMKGVRPPAPRIALTKTKV